MFVALKVEEERRTVDDFHRRCVAALGARAVDALPATFESDVIEKEIVVLEALNFQLMVFQPTGALQGFFYQIWVRPRQKHMSVAIAGLTRRLGVCAARGL